MENFLKGYKYAHKLPGTDVFRLSRSRSDGGGEIFVIKHLTRPHEYYGYNGRRYGYYGNGFRELLDSPGYASRSLLVEILAFSDRFNGIHHLGHPAFLTYNGYPAYVMELCYGNTSELITEGKGIETHVLKRFFSGSTTRDDIIGKFTQIFDQLHTDGFVHGDIKPANVFFNR